MAKTLMVQDITPETRNVFVTNNTEGRERGPIFFTVHQLKGNGVDNVVVPNTWMAVDLTSQVHPQQLLESNTFRRLVNSNLVTILTDEEADKINSREGAESEIQRLRKEEFNIEATLSGNGLGSRGSVEAKPTVEQTNIGQPSMKVEVLMAEAEKTDEVSLINALRNIKSELVEPDYKFVRKVAKGLGYKSLTRWCNNQLKKIK
ncbi:hypothetical protein GR7B_00099 [Vibrio phage vB_VcorM_GR7B]|nr:hypothetical protein GR7B_00099 [Vibrio phage vB_VcorM_GR7B]